MILSAILFNNEFGSDIIFKNVYCPVQLPFFTEYSPEMLGTQFLNYLNWLGSEHIKSHGKKGGV